MKPTQIIDPSSEKQMVAIARAMAFVECGVEIDEEKFHSAWALI